MIAASKLIEKRNLLKRVSLVGIVSLIMFLVLALAGAGSTLLAQGNTTATSTVLATSRPVTNDEVNQIARNLYCPVCQNVSLDVCTTAACEVWRGQIRQLLSQGKTEPEIRTYFIQHYGIRVEGTAVDPGTPTPTASPTARPVTNDEVNKISRNLYCPVCQNIPLEVCDTAACEEWRGQVREMLAEGKTEPEIRAYFIGRYGVRTVGTPPDLVNQILTIGAPLALISIIGLVTVITLIRWRTGNNTENHPTDEDHLSQSQSGSSASDDYRTRVEAELKERD